MNAPARDLLAVGRRITGPTIIEPLGGPQDLESFEALVARVREIIAQACGGRRPQFGIGHAAHPDLDGAWPSLTVRIDGAAVATLFDRWRDLADVQAARRILETSL